MSYCQGCADHEARARRLKDDLKLEFAPKLRAFPKLVEALEKAISLLDSAGDYRHKSGELYTLEEMGQADAELEAALALARECGA